jgi:hypothetical protein
MNCKLSLSCPMSHVTMWIEYIECNIIELLLLLTSYWQLSEYHQNLLQSVSKTRVVQRKVKFLALSKR